MAGAHSARPKIVVLGSMCRLPVPGVVYQLLHYLIGLERLGYEAYYIEWHGNWVDDPTRSGDGRVRIDQVLETHGFADRWSCRDPRTGAEASFGPLTAQAVSGLYQQSVAIINVTGAHQLTDEMLRCPIRVYVETDPGIPQIRLSGADPQIEELMEAHTHHATFGELVGRPSCRLPAAGYSYLPTRQPVVIDLWEASTDPGSAITSVARWKKPKDKSITFEGSLYHWNKGREFLKFLDLPSDVERPLRLALAEVPVEDLRALRSHGWHIENAMTAFAGLDDYRAFIARSWAEFTIAKDQYVRLRTGWFSDRSACYLASGRPVVTQDTGFSEVLPTGAGLFAFSDRSEAIAALEEINRNPKEHREAARQLARSYFDSDTVLSELLERCGVDLPAPSAKSSSAEDRGLQSVVSRAPGDWRDYRAQALGSHRVVRLHSAVDPRVSLVAKRMTVSAAEKVEYILRSLLPRRELSGLAARLLDQEPVHAGLTSHPERWLIFEDLGDHRLATLAHDSTDSREDLGFLNPVDQPIPVEMLEKAVEMAALMHLNLAGSIDLIRLPRLDEWYWRASVQAAADETRRAIAADISWSDSAERVLEHLSTTERLLDSNQDLIANGSGSETLLHGDLGLNNILASGGDVRFVDWDHAGRGPAAYDLSTLLAQLPPVQRHAALERYRSRNPQGIPLDSGALDVFFELVERARIANVVKWTIQSRRKNLVWARRRLDECLAWYEGLAPLLASAE